MKRCLTLGISLCLIGLLSGCCCGQRCGFGRFGGCYSPCNPCGSCGGGLGGFAPFGGGCSSCGTGGFAPAGTPYGAVPSTYLGPNGTVAVSPDGFMETTGLPPATGAPVTAATPPVYGQPTAYGQPTYGQPASFAENPQPVTPAPVTTALMKPESLATF